MAIVAQSGGHRLSRNIVTKTDFIFREGHFPSNLFGSPKLTPNGYYLQHFCRKFFLYYQKTFKGTISDNLGLRKIWQKKKKKKKNL